MRVNMISKEYSPREINDRYKRDRMKRLKDLGLILCLIIFIAGVIAVNVLPHYTKDICTITVTDKQIKISGKNDKYLIFAKLDTGKAEVFEDTDSMIEGKYNSSDIYGDLEKDKTYKIVVYGWRIPFWSMYRNIITAREVTNVK